MTESSGKGWLKTLWCGLSSNRFGVALIALWAVVCAVGLALPQQVGFDVFRSPLIPVLGALLAVSLVACTARRIGKRRSVFHSGPTSGGDSGGSHQVRVALPSRVSPEEAVEMTEALLAKRRYAVKRLSSDELRAERNRLSRHSSTLTHLALIALIASVAVVALTGFEEPFVAVVEGEEHSIGHETGLIVGLDSFKTDYWPDGTPRAFLSMVTVRREDGTQEEGMIAVNRPLKVNGVRLFQAAYGRAPRISISRDGETVAEVAVPLRGSYREGLLSRPAGVAHLVSLGLDVWVIGAAEGGDDPILEPNQVLVELTSEGAAVSHGQVVLARGAAGDLAGLTVAFVEEKSFSGLSIAKEPALPAIWITAGLFSLGLAGVLWFPYSAISVGRTGRRQEGGDIVVEVRWPKGSGGKRQAARLGASIEEALKTVDHQGGISEKGS
jgi:cytochrome c biogenesis protein